VIGVERIATCLETAAGLGADVVIDGARGKTSWRG